MEIKRQGLWRNHARNRQVARLARRLQAGEWQAIGKGFPPARTGLREGQRLAVAVLVENLEHAEAIARDLPGWRVATDNDWKPGCVGRDVKGAQGSVEPGAGGKQGVIITALGIEKLDLSGVDVLIRADGGVGLPPMTAFPPGKIVFNENNLPEGPAGEPRLVLVDFYDRHHPLLRRWSRQRRAAYAERGWYAAGVEPLERRIELFLAARG
jgi:hypothetical protein